MNKNLQVLNRRDLCYLLVGGHGKPLKGLHFMSLSQKGHKELPGNRLCTHCYRCLLHAPRWRCVFTIYVRCWLQQNWRVEWLQTWCSSSSCCSCSWSCSSCWCCCCFIRQFFSWRLKQQKQPKGDAEVPWSLSLSLMPRQKSHLKTVVFLVDFLAKTKTLPRVKGFRKRKVQIGILTVCNVVAHGNAWLFIFVALPPNDKATPNPCDKARIIYPKTWNNKQHLLTASSPTWWMSTYIHLTSIKLFS